MNICRPGMSLITAAICSVSLLMWTMSATAALLSVPLTSNDQSDSQFSINLDRDFDRFVHSGFVDSAAVDSSLQLLQFNQHFDHASLHIANAYSNNQQLHSAAVSTDQFRLSAYTGDGDTVSDLRGDLNGLHPFHFHGGLRQAFQYNGSQLDYWLDHNTGLSVAATRITSDGLSNRSVYSAAIEHAGYKLSWMQVYRDSEAIGDAVQFDMDRGRHGLQAHWLQQSNQARFAQLSYTWQASEDTRYQLSLINRVNPLAEEHNENRLMFSLLLNPQNKRMRIYATEAPAEESDSTQKKPAKKSSTAIVGVGAVAVGVGLSSGSSGSDSSARLQAQHAAAHFAVNAINPRSVAINREFGGFVFRNADGTFSTTSPIQGTNQSVALPNPFRITPMGSTVAASYHTHAGPDPDFINEQFSPTDLSSDRAFGLDGYLGTPAGRFLYHNVRRDTVEQLGTVAN